MAELNLSDRFETFANKVAPLMEKGWLERTIPDKPNSSNQQYRTTRAGELYLKDELPPVDELEQGIINF